MVRKPPENMQQVASYLVSYVRENVCEESTCIDDPYGQVNEI